MSADPSAHRTVEVVWREESATLVAALSRIVRDVPLAEDLAQDALVAALEQWPRDGVPRNAGAWLMATAKHRAVDRIRRERNLRAKYAQLARDLETAQRDGTEDLDAALDDHVGDDVLRLIFIACHPVLPTAARVALTLRMVGGLTTREIAHAYLVPEATVAQRIVRAKRALGAAAVPFELPAPEDLADRLGSVLEVVYLVFNEGYAATEGPTWTRPELCEEALRLGRLLARLAPAEPEVHGLVALMAIQASRTGARSGPGGEPVLLLDQDRSRWDRELVAAGLASLARAEVLLLAERAARGPYVLQAAIAACHARARTAGETDWARIAALYEELHRLHPSPVVELNRAVAVSMAEGPDRGLAIVDDLAGTPALARYHLLPSVRGDLLARLGRHAEARAEFARAAELTQNERERALLMARAAASERAAGQA
ncbi:RNA polymerase sigma factor [Georgenia sp. AZ-5]|uniref:RNA polymerase sigma factor n=1 Tax=Georgenia sp. AZ-5 TaxID=3367526 RepID=UPI003754A6D3